MTGREDGGRRARWQGRRDGRAEDPGANVFRSPPSTSSAASCAPELVSCPAGLVTRRMRSARQFAPAEGGPCDRGGSLSGSDGRIEGLAGLGCLGGRDRRLLGDDVGPGCAAARVFHVEHRGRGSGTMRRTARFLPGARRNRTVAQPHGTPFEIGRARARGRGGDEAAKGCDGPNGDIPASYQAEFGPVVGSDGRRPFPLRKPGRRACVALCST